MNATVTKKSATKSKVASANKKAAIKPAAKPKAKPAPRTTAKAPAKSVAAKTSKKVVAKAKTPAKTAVKTAKSVAKPAKKVAPVPKKSVKPLAKPAAKVAKKTAEKAVAKPAVKKVSPTPVKISKVVAEKSIPVLQTINTTNAKTQTVKPAVVQNVAIAMPNKDFTVTQIIADKSINNVSAGLTGKIESTEVSKVSKVATKSIKPASDGTLLTEAQILKMSDKDYMNEAQLAFFKARLQQLEIDLLKNAGETTEHLRETVLVPDPADRATIEEEHALELRTRDRERKLLKKVQQSIASIDSGDYGWCEETGEPIGIPRLLARPTATLSLEAQQRRELKQKLYGD